MSAPCARKGIVGAACALLALSCGSDFPERSEITGLRILAVSANPPWIIPGQNAQLTPLVVGITEEERAQLRYRWRWCPLRGPNSANFECLFNVDALNTTTGTSGIEIPPDALELGSESTAELPYALTAESVGCFCNALRGTVADGCEDFSEIAMQSAELSRFVTLPSCRGTFPVSVQLDVALNDRTITAYKDVSLVYDLSQTTALNALPDVSGLRLEPLTAALEPIEGVIAYEQPVTFQLQVDPGQTSLGQLDRLSESFTDIEEEAQPDGTITETEIQTREQLLFSWFSETGLFGAARTGFQPGSLLSDDNPNGDTVDQEWDDTRSNDWDAPKQGDFPDGGETRLYLVVRDGRGGTSWTTSTVAVGSLP